MLWTLKHFYQPRWQSPIPFDLLPPSHYPEVGSSQSTPWDKGWWAYRADWEVQGHWQGGGEGFRQGEAARTAHQLPPWAAAAYSCRAGPGNGRKHTSEWPRSMVTVLEYLSPDICESLDGISSPLCMGQSGSGCTAFWQRCWLLEVRPVCPKIRGYKGIWAEYWEHLRPCASILLTLFNLCHIC